MNVTIKEFLDAGVHFAHIEPVRWNSKWLNLFMVIEMVFTL